MRNFLHRAEEKQYFAAALWSRRMAALLLIGLFHLVFFWYGDILHVYAISGFIILFTIEKLRRFCCGQ